MPIEIFKCGKHKDMSGKELDFSEAELVACAACYDPALHEAPLVLGHPKHNDPAYGWVSSLSFSEGSLLVEPDQVETSFAEAVKAGRYKKISASFYQPDSTNNPVPGSYYLRHVGFLGGQVPAVKGLKPVEFAGNDEDCVTVEFGEELTVARILRSVREFFVEKFGKEEADKAMSSWDVDWLQEQAAREDGRAEFSEDEHSTPDNSGQGEEEMKKKGKPDDSGAEDQAANAPDNQSEIDALKKQNAEFAEQFRRRDAKDEVKGLVDAGQLTPAIADGLVDFMAGLDTDGTTIVEFGEGDDQKKLSPRKFMSDFLKRLPQQVDFGEQSKGSEDDENPGGMSAEEVANEAVSYRESMNSKGVVLSATEAVEAVKAGKHKGGSNG
ncbi:hypothetical protein [Maridesulfovibrio sp.]|uniref:hypothetical protein n=1 Tax=Maridesulfovibrio sp. TaxID=2795000 RepID=UPI0029CA9FD3|nr:hypothetical protein [Maridesulfovibrio sp.]